MVLTAAGRGDRLMGMRIIVACEGEWSIPCRAFLPFPYMSGEQAAAKARLNGWTVDDEVLCPACTRRERGRADA